MKINQHTTSLMHSPLLKKTSTADDNYWQQQLNLQQSDIHFNKHLTDSEQLSLNQQNISQTIQSTTPTHSQKQLITLAIDIHIEKTNNRSHPLSMIEWEPGLSVLKENGLQAGEYIIFKNTQDSSRKINQLFNQSVKSILVPMYKKHQMYMDEHRVELAFNTHDLSKQNLTKLQAMLKHWLNQKGYTLKKLLINGEAP